MSVVYKGDVNLGISISASGRSAKRKLIFYCENGETAMLVRKHSNFPAIGEKHPDDPDMRCSSITITPTSEGTRNKYEVEVSYATNDASKLFSSSEASTTYGVPFDVSITAVENIVPFEFSYDKLDKSGHPIMPVATTAGTAIAANTVKISLQLNFSYYLKYFKPEWILDSADTVNLDHTRVCGIDIPPECGLIKSLSSKIISSDSGKTKNSAFQIDVSMEINSDGFLRSFPNKGFYFRSSATANPIRIFTCIAKTGYPVYGSDSYLNTIVNKNSNVVPIDEPLWLNSTGEIVSSQSGPYFVPYFVKFKEKRPQSWSRLSLPANTEL